MSDGSKTRERKSADPTAEADRGRHLSFFELQRHIGGPGSLAERSAALTRSGFFASLPMMPRCGFLLSVAIAFWPLPANAQPLFHYERNWTITTGEHLYGLRQVAETPGDRRWTQVWIGRSAFDMRCRADEVIALILLSRADLVPRVAYLVDWKSFRRLP
jgi:hypothetical protein